MALKAHFALLAFAVCTAYTSLRPFWTTVGTSQRPVRGRGSPCARGRFFC